MIGVIYLYKADVLFFTACQERNKVSDKEYLTSEWLAFLDKKKKKKKKGLSLLDLRDFTQLIIIIL